MSRQAFSETLDATMIHNAGMHKLPQVLKRIQRFYCMPMTTANHCPAVCSLCTKHLNEVISNVDPLRAKSPYAVLVWRLRNSTSRMIEERSKVHVAIIPRNVFGEAVEVDALDAMLAGLG